MRAKALPRERLWAELLEGFVAATRRCVKLTFEQMLPQLRIPAGQTTCERCPRVCKGAVIPLTNDIVQPRVNMMRTVSVSNKGLRIRPGWLACPAYRLD